jgi:hypothetical protein
MDKRVRRAEIAMRGRIVEGRSGPAVVGLALAIFAGQLPVAADADTAPPIYVGGRAVHERAIMHRGHVLVPVRGVFEALHADVSYTPPRVVVVRKHGAVVAGLLIGRFHAILNNRARHITVAPIRQNDRVYVPLRLVAEILGATVTYESHPRLISIHVPVEELAVAPPPPPVLPSPEPWPPMWLVGVFGSLVIALAFESFRRLTGALAARRAARLALTARYASRFIIVPPALPPGARGPLALAHAGSAGDQHRIGEIGEQPGVDDPMDRA